MGLMEIILIGLSLSLDAFTVSICKGIAINNKSIINNIKVGVYFGIFQFFMPILGFTLASSFSKYIIKYDHFISFFLLLLLGINMIKEKEEGSDDDLSFKTMIMLSIATSIDALAVGVTFTFLNVNIISSSILIGIITFIMCFIGVFLGNKVDFERSKAKKVGGIVLIIIGLRILISHLFL